MLQALMRCCISHKFCWGSRGEGDGEGAVVSFSWRLHDPIMLQSPCQTNACYLLNARPWLCPRPFLRNGKCYSIWVNREEKRQINNEVDWTLPALLLYSSLRGLKRWYGDGLLNKSVQLLTFTAAEQFSSSITISLICREGNKKCVQEVIEQGAQFGWGTCSLWHGWPWSIWYGTNVAAGQLTASPALVTVNMRNAEMPSKALFGLK